MASKQKYGNSQYSIGAVSVKRAAKLVADQSPASSSLLPPQKGLPAKRRGPNSRVHMDWESERARREALQGSQTAARHKYDASTVRDISDVPLFSHFKPIDFTKINWDRRLKAKEDPVYDLQTYMPHVFYLPFGDFHHELVNDIESRIHHGGRKATALPRASGKTAICRGMILRAIKFGLRRFLFFIGAKEDKAIQTLKVIKTFLYRAELLQEDFPELCYPIYRIEGRSSIGSIGQIYKGERTHIMFTSNEFQAPCLLLTEEDAAPYLKNDPSCIKYLKQYDRFLINSGGIITRVSGIDGSIRGEADVHPLLMTQPRPDFILLDDVQKDETAKSPKSCEDLESLIEAAVDMLAAPDVNPAILMPCTVIREGDVSDTYLTPDMKPLWDGTRHGLVRKFPDCIDYEKIYDELDNKPCEQGKLWLEYKEVWEQSLRKFHDLRLSNEFYTLHKEILENNFEATWDARKKTSDDPNKCELTAIMALMNWRFKDHLSYLSEGENRPRLKISGSSITLTVEEVKQRMSGIPKAQISSEWTNLVAFIDVQDEFLPWGIFAHDLDYNGQFIDYGFYPEITVPNFRKWQANGWALLTRDFYKLHPDIVRQPRLNRDRGLKPSQKAPFEAKIFSGLEQLVKRLLSREFSVQGTGGILKIRAIAIDTKWGLASDTIKKFVRESTKKYGERVMCYEGHPFLPSYRQLEEYDQTRPGWVFEQTLHPQMQESKWCVRPYAKNPADRYIQADVNRLKSFLMKRLASPRGSEGAITIYEDIPDRHTMFAMHICSEYPELIIAGARQKDCWQVKDGFRSDNDMLDIAVGCMALASICGASLKTDLDKIAAKNKRKPQSLKQVYEQKKRRRDTARA